MASDGSAMTEDILIHRGTTLVRRMRLAPGEKMPWHRDPHHRITVVLSGDALGIEFRDDGKIQHISIKPGQVDWDEPTHRMHRGINLGVQPYEEITVFLLDRPDAEPQPQD